MPASLPKKHAPNRRDLSLLAFSFLFSIGLAEVALRVWQRFSPDTAQVPRCLLWSKPAFETDSSGVVSLAKSRTIREVAVYDGQIDYDIQYQTNRLGFPDSVEFDFSRETGRASSYLALVGDSFTAGAGGYNWVADVRSLVEHRSGLGTPINMGIPGVGLHHFRGLLASIPNPAVFSHIVLLAISSDLPRPLHRTLESENRVFYCLEEDKACLQRDPVAHLIAAALPAESILAQSAADAKCQATATSPSWFRSELLSTLKRTRGVRRLASAAGLTAPVPVATPMLLDPLQKIREIYPKTPLHFIHLPERHEVVQGAYSVVLADQIEKLGYRYLPALNVCGLSREHFHKYDAHPNAKGYAQIAKCVGEYLKGI